MINTQRENVKKIIIEMLKNGNKEEVVLKKQYIDNLNNILSKLDNIRELIKNPTISSESEEFVKAIEGLTDSDLNTKYEKLKKEIELLENKKKEVEKSIEEMKAKGLYK